MKIFLLLYFCFFYTLNLAAQLDKSSIEVQIAPSIGSNASVDIGDNIYNLKKNYLSTKEKFSVKNQFFIIKKEK
jgi:hypothetical protein